MPIYGLGTFMMGGRRERDFSNNDEADIQGIRNALDAGVTHIDTAEKYGDGYTEVLVGKAIEGYDRSKIFLVSKVQSKNMTYEGILNSCKESLVRLKTNYLDLYLLHSYNPEVSLQDCIRALDTLVADGLIRNIGVCNFTKEHLAEAQSYTKNKIVCNQVHYNLIIREVESLGLLNYCQQNDVFLVAYRPIERGDLLQNIPDVIKEMVVKYKATPAQIALNWLVSQPYVIALSKTRSMDHLNENLGVLNWVMENSDIERIRKEYPNQTNILDGIALG